MSRVLRRCTNLGLMLSGGVDSTYLAATAVGMGFNDMHALTASFEPECGAVCGYSPGLLSYTIL